MALVQKITGTDKLGAAFPLRVAIFENALEMARKATDVVEQLELDDVTNEVLVADLVAHVEDYALNAGVLLKKGTPVVIAGDSAQADVLKKVKQYVTDVRSGVTRSLTPAQRLDKLEAAVAALLVTTFQDRVI